MSTTDERHDIEAPLKYAPPWVRQSSNRLVSPTASEYEQQTAFVTNERNPELLSDTSALDQGHESNRSGPESFVTMGPDPAKWFSRDDFGLTSLITDVEAKRISLELKRRCTVPIRKLRPNPLNPRSSISNDELADLADSIREWGVLQPIMVRAIPGVTNEYEIVAGERRWRAAQRAGLQEIPVILCEVNNIESLELAIIENMQRSDLAPLEQASAYQVLIDQYRYTQDEVAKIIGKSRSFVANMLRLLDLPQTVKDLLQSGKLTASHARTLVGLPNAEQLAKEIVELELSVRQVEEKTESTRQVARRIKSGARAQKSAELISLQSRLSDLVGLVVTIDHRGAHGVLRIRYNQIEQLEMLARQLEGCKDQGDL